MLNPEGGYGIMLPGGWAARATPRLHQMEPGPMQDDARRRDFLDGRTGHVRTAAVSTVEPD
jgi:hypothetical protein